MPLAINETAEFRRHVHATFQRREFLYDELAALIYSIVEMGEVLDGYSPHMLVNPKRKYTSLNALHLSDADDVVIVYQQTDELFTLVDIGSHAQIYL